MIQRAESGTQAGSRLDCTMHEIQTIGDRGLERPAERKAGSDRSRQSAAGPMQRAARDPRLGEVANSIGSHQHVRDLIAVEMASLHQGGARAEAEQSAPGALHGRGVVHRSASKNRSFIEVGSYQSGEREKIFSHDVFCFAGEKSRARG